MTVLTLKPKARPRVVESDPVPLLLAGAFGAPTLSEMFSGLQTAAPALAFVMGRIAPASGPVLFVQDAMTRKNSGVPYLPGQRHRLLRATLSRAEDVLIAMEEGLQTRALAAVVGEVWGDARAVDFTATRRLAIRAERNGVTCWLIRHSASADLSGARNRWRLSPLPSAAHPDDPQAPGRPRWQAELFRSRLARPGKWVVCHDQASGRLDFSAALSDEPLGEDRRPDRRDARA
jgi:protein ImuA